MKRYIDIEKNIKQFIDDYNRNYNKFNQVEISNNNNNNNNDQSKPVYGCLKSRSFSFNTIYSPHLLDSIEHSIRKFKTESCLNSLLDNNFLIDIKNSNKKSNNFSSKLNTSRSTIDKILNQSADLSHSLPTSLEINVLNKQYSIRDMSEDKLVKHSFKKSKLSIFFLYLYICI